MKEADNELASIEDASDEDLKKIHDELKEQAARQVDRKPRKN